MGPCNHVHLLARSLDPEGISAVMQRVEGRFAQYYNRRKKRNGAFWEDRYHATLVDGGEHLERCMSYIEMNIVRAGRVSHPKEWVWCSFQEWTGGAIATAWCIWTMGLKFLGDYELGYFRGQTTFQPCAAMMVRTSSCRRSGDTAPRLPFISPRSTANIQSHLHSVGQSSPSASSKRTSVACGRRLARWEEQSKISTKSLWAARKELETITTGCIPQPRSAE